MSIRSDYTGKSDRVLILTGLSLVFSSNRPGLAILSYPGPGPGQVTFFHPGPGPGQMLIYDPGPG